MPAAPDQAWGGIPASAHHPGEAWFGTVKALSGRLLAAPTACAALASWCTEHGLGDGPIRAERHATGHAAPPDEALLDALSPRRGEAMPHRRVTLWRGGVPLSDCDLWWLPGRLQPGMVDVLHGTDVPFGTVVAPLRPSRRTLFAALLPGGGPHVLEHRAVVLAGGRRPIAAVRERYRAILIPARAAPPADGSGPCTG